MSDYGSRVVPIGMLYAMSLWLSNSSYLYLSVSFIQVGWALIPSLSPERAESASVLTLFLRKRSFSPSEAFH